MIIATRGAAPSLLSKLVKRLNLTQYDLSTVADIMFLAWRKDYTLENKTGVYRLKRDILIEQAAETEQKFRCYYAECKKCNISHEEYDTLLEFRVTLILKICEVPFGLDLDSDDYEDRVYNLSRVGDNLGWDAVLREVTDRIPERLELIPNKKKDRHWHRAMRFYEVKYYSEILQRSILGALGELEFSNPIPYLELQSIKFSDLESWHHTLGLMTPSDETIFSEYKRIMANRSHKYFELFKAVNKDTDFLLLNSKKALERTLTKGRKQIHSK